MWTHECPVCSHIVEVSDQLEQHQSDWNHYVCDYCSEPSSSTSLVYVRAGLLLCEPCFDRYLDARAKDSAAGP